MEKTCCALGEENAQCLDSTDVCGYDMFVDFLFDVLSNGPSTNPFRGVIHDWFWKPGALVSRMSLGSW